jgi:peptide/nickel transport system substrate-binding protein
MIVAVACGGDDEEETTSTAAESTASTSTASSSSSSTTSSSTASTSSSTETAAAKPEATTEAAPAAESSVKPKSGGRVISTGSRDPVSFDVHNATSSVYVQHNAKMYSSLVWSPAAGVIVPDAAKEWAISDDGKTWTFTLEDNVMYHSNINGIAGPRDGTAMTGKDVEYSMEKIMGLVDGVVSARSGWMKEFVDIDRPDLGMSSDGNQVSFHLVQPFAGLIDILAIGFSGIMPDGTTREMLNERSYGSGPYKLKSFERGSTWIYEKDPDYFRAGLPYLDEWEIQLIRSAEVAQSAFLTRQVEVSRTMPSPDNNDLYNKAKANGEIDWIGFSTTCRPQGVNMNATKPPFDNDNLRKAVNLAIDRYGYAEVVHFGEDRWTPTRYLDESTWGMKPDEVRKLEGWARGDAKAAEVEEAKKLVAQEFPDGLSLTMLVRDTSTYARQGEFVAGELSKIGIDVTIDLMQASQLFPLAQNLNYEIWSYYFCQTTNTPEELFGSYFLTGGSRNWLGYSSDVVDAKYLELAASPDSATRKARGLALEDIVLADMPSAPLGVQKGRSTFYTEIQNITVPLGQQYMWPKRENVWRTDV